MVLKRCRRGLNHLLKIGIVGFTLYQEIGTREGAAFDLECFSRRHSRQTLALDVRYICVNGARAFPAGAGLAALRYPTYRVPYYLLLRLFGIAPPPEAAFAGIATIFFILSSVPLPPLLGLPARGEIALLVWGVFDVNEFSILAATLGLFIINLFIPALLGLVIVVKTNILKSFSYEKNHNQIRAVDHPGDTSHGFRRP